MFQIQRLMETLRTLINRLVKETSMPKHNTNNLMSPSSMSHLSPYPAETHNGQGLAVQLGAKVSLAIPPSVLEGSAGLG